MEILGKLIITNLKKNKKRTIAVIIAVALSVFLILSIGFTVSSVYTIMLKNTEEQYGEHHVLLKDLLKDNLNNIENKEYISDFWIERNISEDSIRYDAYIKYEDVNKVCEYTNELIKELDINDNSKVFENTELLNLYGIIGVNSRLNELGNIELTSEFNFISLIDAIMIIVLLIVSVSCIVIIYNSFSISQKEKQKQFSTLSSLGASKKQIRTMVFLETSIIGIFGVIIGTILTFVGINIIFTIINNILKSYITYQFKFIFNLKYMFICLLFIIITIYLSAFISVINMTQNSLIEQIRDNKRNKSVKLNQGIFGVEKSIAKKNIKMNKNKYGVIIFSLSLVMILFNSVASYILYQESLMQIVETKFGDAQILLSLEKDLSLEEKSKNDKELDKIKEKILKFNDVEDYYDYRVLSLSVNLLDINKTYFNDIFYKQTVENELNMPAERVNVIGLEEKDYIEYIELVDAEYGDNIILNHTYLSDELNSQYTYTKIFRNINNLKIDFYDSIGFCDIDGNISTHSEIIGTLNNLVLTDKEIMVFNEYNSPKNIVVYTNMDTYNKIYERTYINCKDKIIDEDNWGYNNFNELRILNLNVSNIIEFNNYINNICEENNKEFYIQIPELENAEKTLLIKVIKILSYIVIGIMLLIGIATTFNIISSSLHERKHEISIMRSVGLEEKGLRKLLFFESLNLFIKALIISIPFSLIINYFIKKSISDTLIIEGVLIPYKNIVAFIIGIFIGLLMITNLLIKLVCKNEIIERLKY